MWRLNSKFVYVHVKNVENSGKRAHPWALVSQECSDASCNMYFQKNILLSSFLVLGHSPLDRFFFDCLAPVPGSFLEGFHLFLV